ncbi:MAG: GntR family transcriptional regulator [Mycobacterium sp.]
MSNPQVTRGGQVYHVMRYELLNGSPQPGQKLRMVQLAERFGVSQSVIREVLTRLGEQGLVTATPQRGFRVRELSVADITGLTESRVEIETFALRLAIERGDVQWEAGVITAFHMLERVPLDQDSVLVNDEWVRRHREFHSALTIGCKNDCLQNVVLELRDSAELYRRWYWALAGDEYHDLLNDHRELKDLTLARDGTAAVGALTAHITRAPRQLVAYAHRHHLDDLNCPPLPVI